MSLLVNNQPYSEEAYGNIYEYLQKETERGEPVEFDVFVDGLRVVRKTADPEQLYEAHKFIKPGFTKVMYINLYNYGNSNHYDRAQFHFGDVNPEFLQTTPVPKNKGKEEGLSGVEVQKLVHEGVEQARKEMEFEQLKKEFGKLEVLLKEKDKEIEELEEDIEKLEQEKADMIARESPLKGVLGEVGAGVVESLIKRNPKTIASIIPGGESLAGFLEEDEKKRMMRLSAPANESEVVFTEKNETKDVAMEMLLNLRSQLNDEEFAKVLQILDVFIADRSRLNTIYSLVTES